MTATPCEASTESSDSQLPPRSSKAQARAAATEYRNQQAAYLPPLVPPLRPVHQMHNQQHHRHLNQHPHHGRQRSAGVHAEQADGGGHGQLKKVGRADQRGGAGHVVLLAQRAVQRIGVLTA